MLGDMNSTYWQVYFREVFPNIPWVHWLVIGFLSLALTVFHLSRNKCLKYESICFGMTFFAIFFLIDTAVLIRLGDGLNHSTEFSLVAEYHRLVHGGVARRIEMLSNIGVFVPFGFFLSEFLFATRRADAQHRLGYVVMASFGLSLSIECLQLILGLGVFEVTDLVLNTLGGFVGASLATVGSPFRWREKKISQSID